MAVQYDGPARHRAGQLAHQNRHVAQVAVAHHAEARPIFEFGCVHLPDVEVGEAHALEGFLDVRLVADELVMLHPARPVGSRQQGPACLTRKAPGAPKCPTTSASAAHIA